jgi:ribosome-binding factor A
MAILTELRDPRVRDVTVTYVQVSPDMRRAKVNVSVMGDEAKQQLSLRGLQSAAGFLQQKVADRIDTRYTPRLTFVLDKGVKHSIEVSRILDELSPADAQEPGSAPDAAAATTTPPVSADAADPPDAAPADD